MLGSEILADNNDVNIDIIEARKKEKRRRIIIKLIIFAVIIIIVGGLYYFRDSWYPRIEGLGEKYQTTIQNNGKLAEGNFPIEITGSSEYQFEVSNRTGYLLNDAYIYIYNQNGGLVENRQHGYSNPVMKACNGKALIYESGGYNLRVESYKKTVFSKKMENIIIFARMNENYIAVVTASDKYSSVLTVYDRNGNFVYKRECVERIIDISFTEDSKGCLLSFINARNGSLVNITEKISFENADPIWISEPAETFCIASYPLESGGAVVLGEEECAYYDDSGKIINSSVYGGTFGGGVVDGEHTAIITNDEQRRKYILTLIPDQDSEPIIINSESFLKDVAIYDNCAYIMTSKNIMAYDFSGQLRSIVEISDAYNSFRRSDNYIFLLGYDKIDRINYNN